MLDLESLTFLVSAINTFCLSPKVIFSTDDFKSRLETVKRKQLLKKGKCDI